MRVLTAGRGRVFVAGTLLLSLVAGSAAALCPGDCSRDGAVTIDELLTTVDIALGKTAMGACTLGDVDRDQRIAVDELVLGVGSALNGCPIASTVLVDKALRSGALDEKTAALYELYARFAPERLPQAYRGAPSTDGSVIPAAVATAHLDEYTPEERQAALAMLVAPTDPRFMRFPEPVPAMGSAASGAGAAQLTCFQQLSGLLDFGNPIDGDLVNGAPLTQYFRFIPAVLPPADPARLRATMLAYLSEPVTNSGAVGASFSTLGAYFDAAFEYFVKDVGMKDPLALPITMQSILDTMGMGSGDPRIPVYVFECPGGSQNGSAYPYGHIDMTLGDGLRDPTLRRITLVHELFHILEFETQSATGPTDADNWPTEAAAVYMEDIVADDVQRWRGNPPGTGVEAFNRSFRCPEEPFHSDEEGNCEHPDRQDVSQGSYSKFVFFKYLAARLGQPPTKFMAPYWWSFNGSVITTFNKLDWSQYVPDFQVALLGDIPGQPGFSATDRLAFKDLDYDRVDNPLRYTFFVEADRFKSPPGAKSWRISPVDLISGFRLPPFVLDTGGGVAPLQRGGTHRWLINVPAAATALADFELATVIRATQTSPANLPVKVLLAPYNGSTIDVAKGVTGNTLAGRRAVSEPSTRYLAVITSDPSDPGNNQEYEGGLTLTRSCIDDCRPFYAAEATTQNCCEQRYAELQVANPAEYARQVAACRTDAPKMTRPLCEYICNSTEKPYPATSFISPRDLGALVCGAPSGPVRDRLSGLVELSDWPTGFTCDEMLLQPITVRAIFGDYAWYQPGVRATHMGESGTILCNKFQGYTDGPLPIGVTASCGNIYGDFVLEEPSPGVITLDGDAEVPIYQVKYWNPYGTVFLTIATRITVNGPGTLTLEANRDWGDSGVGWLTAASLHINVDDPARLGEGWVPGCQVSYGNASPFYQPSASCSITTAGDYLLEWRASLVGTLPTAAISAGHGRMSTVTFTQ